MPIKSPTFLTFEAREENRKKLNEYKKKENN